MISIKISIISLAIFSTSVINSACVQKNTSDAERNMATLNLMVLDADVKSLESSGFAKIGCGGIQKPNLAAIEEKCVAMLAMPKELQANFFNQFQISIETMCKVSKNYLTEK